MGDNGNWIFVTDKQMDRQTQSDAYEPTVQGGLNLHSGLKNCQFKKMSGQHIILFRAYDIKIYDSKFDANN